MLGLSDPYISVLSVAALASSLYMSGGSFLSSPRTLTFAPIASRVPLFLYLF